MISILIGSGRIIDPANNLDAVADILCVDGLVAGIGPHAKQAAPDRVIDATGLLVSPGLIDAHVHLRDPGFTHKEDLRSGATAAAAGGFTRICCMPNTSPVLDTSERIADVVERGRKTSVDIHAIGAISVGQAGTKLAPLAGMAAAGAIGFSDDGVSTSSTAVMRQALVQSRELGLPIMVHCEDPGLARPGAMHQGTVSRRLGDPGIPAHAEESYIARDIELAAETGGWLHVLHVSTVNGAELVRQAKTAGVHVTAEVMPHHLTMTDEWVAGARRFAGELATDELNRVDTNAKVNPPLRPEIDALGLIDYVLDGTFDFIATDHAPHAVTDKPDSLQDAAFGMIGLEVAIPLLQRLVARKVISWRLVLDLLSRKPASTLGLPGGRLGVGDQADITLIDPERAWQISESTIKSRSKNTPLLGMNVTGKAVLTMVGGEVIHDDRG